jgi:hypothetical protein
MNATEPRVLLIGENSQGSLHLIKRLARRGCDCRFATSYRDAISLLTAQDFDLVLSPTRIADSSVFPLVGVFKGSRTTWFCFLAVEEGCWWLPTLRFGQECFGSNALRPREFVSSLDLVIDEVQASAVAKTLASMPPVLAAALPGSGARRATVKPVPAERAELVKRKAAGWEELLRTAGQRARSGVGDG